MSPALLSLLALLIVVAASLTARINVGVLAVALAWGIATFAADWKVEQLMAVFPASLFLTLLGVTLLFGIAQANGTMQAVTHAGVRLLRGRSALLPPFVFLLACVISTSGPGAIATTALLAPLAMGLAQRAKAPVLLMALMVGNGANAGNLSPISAIGALVQTLMERAGLGGHATEVLVMNFVAHALVSIAAWALFGGPGMLRAGRMVIEQERSAFTRAHGITLAVGVLWVGTVLLLKFNPGLTAFAAAALLVLIGIGTDSDMLKQVPWPVIVMVCGVSVLIGVLEKTGGMDLFTTALSTLATPGSVNGVIAGVTGLISTYSSTSGVVYPAFIPAVPGLVAKLGGGNPLQIAISINVGAALVDVSPLSTIGALCIAAVPTCHDTKQLFRQLLLWGFAMTIVGALFCQFVVPVFIQ